MVGTPEPPAKHPCVSPATVVTGRHQRPDCCTPSPPTQRGQVQRTVPWVETTPPPPPVQWVPEWGEGGAPDTGGERQ